MTNPFASFALQILIVDATIAIRTGVMAPRCWVMTPIRIAGSANATVWAPHITTAMTTRTVTKITRIPTTATKVCTIDMWAEMMSPECDGHKGGTSQMWECRFCSIR